MRLLETLRAEDGRIARLDRHLARLAASAERLGWGLDVAAVGRHLEAVAGEGVWRVRLTVGDRGDVQVEAAPLDAAPMRTAWIDPEPFAEAGSLRCVLKTTDREHYRTRWERAQGWGADEAILVNARGEITEGTRTTVWARLDGRWCTPPLSAGGLAGVERAHHLATRPDCLIAPLTPGALRQADAVALTNALRGWMPVRLVDPARPSGVQTVPLPNPPSDE